MVRILPFTFRVWITGLALVGLGATALEAVDEQGMRYGFKAGQRCTYDVKIEADLPEAGETVTGHSFYTVKSVDAATGQITLSNSGSLATRRQIKPSNRPRLRPPGPPSPFASMSYGLAREVVIDAKGNVIKYSGDTQLPFLLGNLWQLVIEPLPADAKASWQIERPIEVFEKDGRFRSLPPFMPQRQVNRSARESVAYTLGQPAGGGVVMSKKYSLVTEEKSGNEPLLEQSGEGQITFDRQAGLVKLVEMKYTIRLNQENTTVRIPVTVSARLLEGAEAEQVEAQRQAAADAAKAAAAEAARIKPIDEAGIDAALEELKGRDAWKARGACDRLAKAIPVEARRAEVAKALEGALDDRDGFLRVAAAKALAAWGTPQSVPALISVLEDRDFFLRTSAMAALGQIKDPRGAEAVAKQLLPHHGRMEASKVLQAMGPVAEPYVLPLLEDRDWAVQMEACKILGAIGTPKSLEPLKTLSRKANNGLVSREADKALPAIEGRAKGQ